MKGASKERVDSRAASGEEREVAQVIPGKTFSSPDIQTWQPGNLEAEEAEQQSQVEQKAYDDLQEKMRPEILQQTELLKKEAYEEAKQTGFDSGYEEGKKIGQEEAREIALDEARQALMPKIEQLDALLHSLNTPYQLLEKKVFGNLSNLAIHLAEEVIQQEIHQKPEWVMKMIGEAVTALNDSASPIEVRLNPQDYQLIADQQNEFAENWTVTQSDQVATGTCQVKQGVSSVDHNWKNRFENMRVKLQAQAVAEAPDDDSKA